MRDEEGPGSANWLNMVNDIATKVEKKYPDVFVGMFAYLHTEGEPKTVKFRKNVLIYQALLTQNRLDPVTTCPFHANAMRKWAGMAKVYVWDYDANFRNYYQPHPNYFVNGENMRFFNEIGVDGVLLPSSYGTAGDMAPMRTWVTAQMMWNPDQDSRKLTEQFMNGYYGAAGPLFMKYFDVMVAAAGRVGVLKEFGQNWS